MRYLVPAGGTAVFLLLMVTILFIPPVGAQEPVVREEPVETTIWFGYYNYPALLMLAAVVGVTAAGLLALKRPQPWPLWPAFVRGLGDAGFLFSIIATFEGLRVAMLTVARIGAAVTPADIAAGLGQTLLDLTLGAVVALAGLGGAALLRLRQARIRPAPPGTIAEKFS